MNKRLKELARQAKLSPNLIWEDAELERFADLVRQDERELCAKLCESMGVHPALNVWNGGPDWYKRQKECAAAIRARGNHEQD